MRKMQKMIAISPAVSNSDTSLPLDCGQVATPAVVSQEELDTSHTLNAKPSIATMPSEFIGNLREFVRSFAVSRNLRTREVASQEWRYQ